MNWTEKILESVEQRVKHDKATATMED